MPAENIEYNRTLSGPEHQQVRLPVIEKLVEAGWSRDQIRWQPEWRVPQAPHGAALREEGKSFSSWPVDLALFDDPAQMDDWRHVVVLFEFKAPDLRGGTSQLETYLAREPRAKLGFWTNGTEDVRIYKLPDGNFRHERNRGIPRPGEELELPSEKPLTYNDLQAPQNGQLKSVFKRLLDVVVARDSRATRSEAQLNELCNLLLLKIESDTFGQFSPDQPLEFQLAPDGETETAKRIRADFHKLTKSRPQVFADSNEVSLNLDDHTIQDVVYELSGLDLVSMSPEAISSAFQVFRRANLKAGEGQYFTPHRVIEAAVKIMEIRPDDTVIDPACGTGGFLVEAFLAMIDYAKASGAMSDDRARSLAAQRIYGVDKDAINVKLARAIMLSLSSDASNIHAGDSVREDRWNTDYEHLVMPLADGRFSVVLTNPPFGQGLKVSSTDARRNKYTIARRADGQYRALEIGLIFLERAHRLLASGGRLGIILPETYFFSATYSWLPEWLEDRFTLRGVVNIPMEAFQGFCRAKTNLYIFEKK
ncbi:N-6 DNA methylase [Actinoplanes sp. LDG1-06]|uniref:N-6 DNA methylase n=1 Tax=Paractinoplanes ovalisporus TaxID=2810368 RepID=A0ABS2AGP9_9ACTN|nr:N-6 DNA methylase [Actinoplanes ovalisporus]MBM2619004.1 N-6 DNA methylase [Actinoplanes ovalisporus]